MEIEAKFRVPDDVTFQRLLEAATLAGFILGPPSMSGLHDRYLDTPSSAFRTEGFAFRLRRQDDQHLATLKGLGKAEGAIHRRAEYEVELSQTALPSDWPPGAARDLALKLCGDEPLTTVAEIHQMRYTRSMTAADRDVAHLHLDQVSVCTEAALAGADAEVGREPSQLSSPGPEERAPEKASGSTAEDYLELEGELLPGGSEQDLEAIASELEGTWGLVPETRSKFERAQDLAAAGSAAGSETEVDMEPHLSPEERALIERLARERAVIARRALLLLAWDDGLSVSQMAERSGLSPRRARHWRWLFRERRLGVFPARWLRAYEAAEPVRPARPKKAAKAARGKKARAGRPLGQEAPKAAEEAPARRAPVELLKRPGIEPDDLMAEAGRKTLRFHFRRMLYHEPGTRRGEDIEALHDMRVATRRMRAAFRAFDVHFEPQAVAPLLKGLRQAGRALGAVRDLDVFRDKVLAYRETLQEHQTGGLDGFLAELEEQRGAARERMIAFLDSGKYRSFVQRLGEFAETEGLGSRPFGLDSGEPRPCRVRHVAPMAIYERLAEVRAYDEWVMIPDPPLTRLHALRIACKRLRYTLEFFQEVLGPETKVLVRDAVAVQDHLGLVQDGVVASGILRDYLVWGTWAPEVTGKRLRGTRMPLIAPGVATYLALRQSEVQQLVAGFPAIWPSIMGPEYSRGVAAAVSVL